MTQAGSSAPRGIVLFNRALKARSVQSDAADTRRRRRQRRWQPPEGVSAEQALSIVAAARCQLECPHVNCQRNQLLLRVLWVTGGRISEALELTPGHVLSDSLVLPIFKNGIDDDGTRPWHRVFLPSSQADLPACLLLWANAHQLERGDPLFFATKNRQRPHTAPLRAISRQMAWYAVKDASARAGVSILAMRASKAGGRGQPAPIHPHIFRHARAREIVRRTKNLVLAQRQLGWSQLHLEYLTIGDLEARELMSSIAD